MGKIVVYENGDEVVVSHQSNISVGVSSPVVKQIDIDDQEALYLVGLEAQEARKQIHAIVERDQL